MLWKAYRLQGCYQRTPTKIYIIVEQKYFQGNILFLTFLLLSNLIIFLLYNTVPFCVESASSRLLSRSFDNRKAAFEYSFEYSWTWSINRSEESEVWEICSLFCIWHLTSDIQNTAEQFGREIPVDSCFLAWYYYCIPLPRSISPKTFVCRLGSRQMRVIVWMEKLFH